VSHASKSMAASVSESQADLDTYIVETVANKEFVVANGTQLIGRDKNG